VRSVRIGAGAGYAGDRIEPAVELAEKGEIQYLVFECLAERTIALAQKARRQNPALGYDPLLEERMEAVLGLCAKGHIRIISNMGAANPRGAVAKTREIAQRIGLRGLRIASVMGDDVLDCLRTGGFSLLENGNPVESLGERMLSANAYLGAESLVEALAAGADVILTGRVADPALFLAPLIHEFGWSWDHWKLLGQGTVVGHLLECAGQLTGGYFADPGYKDVPDLARLGFPLAEVSEDGTAALTKVQGSGGMVTRATCTEQLLYEIEDPAAYLTPDVIADFSHATLEETGKDRVRVAGGSGREKPKTLKVSVGLREGFVGEAQISYAGPGAVARAKLAQRIVAERLKTAGLEEVRFDLIGMNAIHGAELSKNNCEPHEVRLRVAGRAGTEKAAAKVLREVEALYTNGPAGGGGVAGSTRETIAMLSTLLPRNLVRPVIEYLEA
jgi:Acyclic terpene utilisation family protein AtuA